MKKWQISRGWPSLEPRSPEALERSSASRPKARTIVTFPPHALLILEERLKQHQAEGLLPLDVSVTALALRILAVAGYQRRSLDLL